MAQSEPGITASVIGGGFSLAALGYAGYDALIEQGWQPKAAMFMVMGATGVVNIIAALWARRSTVTRATYNAAVTVAQVLPSGTDTVELNKVLAAQPEPLPAVTPAPVIDAPKPDASEAESREVTRPRRIQ